MAWTSSAAAAELPVTVVTIEGEEQARKLLAISETGFKFDSGDVAFGDVSEIRFAAVTGSPDKMLLRLRNGDQLSAHIVSGDDTKLKLACALGELSLDNKWLDAIVFAIKDGPTPEAIGDFLKAPPAREDQLLLPKGDTASGFLEKFTDKDLSFNAGGQSRVYPFEKVAALRLAPLEKVNLTTAVTALLVLRDESRITAMMKGISDTELLFDAIGGQSCKVKISEIRSIVFKGGKLSYMSDLSPKSVEEKPYAGGVPTVFHWRRNQSVTGGKLAIAGKEYDRGMGVHSYCKLSYELGGQFAKLLGETGMDKDAPANAVCSWKIVADGKEAATGIAKSGMDAAALTIDIKGVNLLELICDYGPDEDDAGDHLDWVNMRLIKQ